MEGRVVPEHSQERRVRDALYQVGVSHNADVTANVNNVQVRHDGLVFFCYSNLRVASERTSGDGGVLPDRVTLEGGWEFPSPGSYDLRNVRIAVNGTISITKAADSELVLVQRADDDRW